jgi:hypothetical protein
MADLSITPANVIAGTGAPITNTIAGATITAGHMVYRDASTERMLLADNNSATAAARVPFGVALHNASNGQPLAVAAEGNITIGATMTAGTIYVLSATPGHLCPIADLASGQYPCVVGIATSTTVLKLGINASGVAL